MKTADEVRNCNASGMGTRRKEMVTTQQNSYLQLDSVPPTLLQSRLECQDKHFPGSGRTVC